MDGAVEMDYNGVVRNPAESGIMEPLRLSEMLQGLEGKWVALKDGEVIEAADNADALFKRLRSKQDPWCQCAPSTHGEGPRG